MNDKAFLRYALEQSFLRPNNNSAESVVLQYNETNSTGYTFIDKKHSDIVPYLLPYSAVKKYKSSVAHDVGRNNALYAEYERYKHDLAENIIIPDNIPEAVRARQVLDLMTVNRQSAQKKKIAATLIPASFALKMKEVHQKYHEIMQTADLALQKNPAAVDLSLIKDFERSYTSVMHRFGLIHPLNRLNKKRMKYYLNEAAQILKSHHPLDEDFCITHCFYSIKFVNKSDSQICTDRLRMLVAQLQRMAHQPQLLTLAQILLADRKKYLQALNNYAADNKINDSARIESIRREAQKLFEKYALLCYLDGVRFAFENKFLNECPAPRHPPLPTVAPQEELKKISKIVAESYQIGSAAGKVGKLYDLALQDYENSLHNFSSFFVNKSA